MEEVKGFNLADSRDPWIQLHFCRGAYGVAGPSVEPWYCCLHSLLLLGRKARWFGDPLWLCKRMCFTVLAMGFVVFATLLWAHGTNHAGAAGAV